MQFQYVSDLKLEFKKFSGFMNPEPVRGPATDAMKFLSNPDICLPIDSAANPIITAFAMIMENKKTCKISGPLVNTVSDCIKSEVIAGDALSSIIRRFEACLSEIDDENAIKIIQLSTRIVSNHFLDIHIFQSILSLILEFCLGKELISTTAIAAADQILDSFLEFAETKSDTLSPDNKRDIDLCFSMSCDNSVTFNKHMDKLVYLVLRDIIRLCCKQGCLMLKIQSLPTDASYTLVNNVLVKHSTYLTSSVHFKRLITDAMKNAHDAPLSFCVDCIDQYMETLPAAASYLFSAFLNDLEPESSKLERSLLFFRVLLLKNTTIIVRFCLNCDQNASILSKLMTTLRNLVNVFLKDRIELSLMSKTFDTYIVNKASTPIEIAVFFVHSCYKAANSALKVLLSKIWPDVLVIISDAAAFVNSQFCYILMQALHSMVVLSHELMLDDARGSAIGSFCTILVAPKGLDADEVRKVAFETVTSAIESSTPAFRGHWSKIMTALSEFKWNPASYAFTTGLTLNHTNEIVVALVCVNDGNILTRQWALNFVVDVMIANMSRFSQLWAAVEANLQQLYEDDISTQAMLNMMIRLIHDGFTKQSEQSICQTLDRLFNKETNLSVETRSSLLEQIRLMLTEAGVILDQGWSSLISAINPNNFEDEENVLNIAFRCVQIICNDLMFSLQEVTQGQIIKLVFEFAGQKTDINVSLTAFGLLWNVVSIAKTIEMWKLIFTRMSQLIADPRNDVSLCAVNTFFSLIVSNSNALPEEIFEYLAGELFNQIIDYLVEPRDESAATQQLAFHEIAHCGRNLWDKFKSVESFSFELWKRMIAEHLNFMKRCQKREVVVQAFQFYEEVFQCEELCHDLQIQLFDSLDDLSHFLIEREGINSVLFGKFGQLIRSVVPTQKSRLTKEFLDRWIVIIERLIFEIDSGEFLPPTAHKTLDALSLLFPLPMELTLPIYESLVKLASSKKNARLTEVAIEHICDITENKVPNEFLPTLFIMSTQLFSMKQARRLLLDFVERDIQIKDEMVDHVCQSLIKLGQSDSELKEKTGNSVLKLFLRVTNDRKTQIIEVYKDCYQTMKTAWARYFDPTSEEFDKESAELCLKKATENIGHLLPECSLEEQILDILQFLFDAQSLSNIYDNNDQKLHYHLFVLLPSFADLVLHPSNDVRTKIREILLLISENK